MDFEKIKAIKKQVVLAIFSDDELMNRFVLKGGSALDLAYQYPLGRTSIDVDLSMADDFQDAELPSIRGRLERALKKTFQKQGYILIDFDFHPRPTIRRPGLPDFWGGYEIWFKIVTMERYSAQKNDIHRLRMATEVVGLGQRRIFEVDISKHEYCEPKIERELDGYAYYVYPPQLLVAEKLRAICQQMPEYPYLGKTRRARARDFYDIYVIVHNERNLSWTGQKFFNLVRLCFESKEVPLLFLARIHDESTRQFHAPDFQAVKATTLSTKGKAVKDYDFYFRFVVRFVRGLKALWVE